MELVFKKYKKTEVGIIPNDWDLKTLGEIGEVIVGLTYSPNDVREYGTLVLRSSNIQDNKLVYQNNVFVQMDLPERVIVREGDLLICVRNGSRNLIGKSVLIDKNASGSAFGAFMSIYRSNINNFISKIFQDRVIQKQIENNLGATINQITNKDLKSFKVPLPRTINEQSAIATALSDMDELIAQTEKLIEKKKAIKQGVMQELLRPKDGWVVKKLGDSADIFRGGSPRPIERYLTNDPDGINWIKIGDVGKFAKYIENTEEKIIPEGMSRSRFVNEGDFLLSNSMSFGRPYILKTNGCIHDGWLVIQNYQEHFDRGFLYYVLGSESVLVQYQAMASGSSVLNLNKEVVKNVLINCPESLDEQAEIATVLSDMDDEIMLQKSNLEKNKLLKQGMMQTLLTGKIRLV